MCVHVDKCNQYIICIFLLGPMLIRMSKPLMSAICLTPEDGALSSLYAATVQDIPDEMKGGTYLSGPNVQPYKWKTNAYSPANSALAFEAIDKVIKSKGFRGFE